MGTSIQMASTLLDVNHGGHLEAKNLFKNKRRGCKKPQNGLKIGQSNSMETAAEALKFNPENIPYKILNETATGSKSIPIMK